MYRPPGTGGAAVAGAGGLALTGASTTVWVVLGIVLLVSGVLMLRFACRRRRATVGDSSDNA